MFNITILEEEDIITEDCFVRPLEIFYDNGYGSDYTGQECMYTGSPQNRFTWTEIIRVAPFWIGRTVSEYNEVLHKSVFCKGLLPKGLVSPLTESEFDKRIYQEYLNNTKVPFIKKYNLIGLTLKDVQLQDEDYFNWLMKSCEVLTLDQSYRDYLDNYK